MKYPHPCLHRSLSPRHLLCPSPTSARLQPHAGSCHVGNSMAQSEPQIATCLPTTARSIDLFPMLGSQHSLLSHVWLEALIPFPCLACCIDPIPMFGLQWRLNERHDGILAYATPSPRTPCRRLLAVSLSHGMPILVSHRDRSLFVNVHLSGLAFCVPYYY